MELMEGFAHIPEFICRPGAFHIIHRAMQCSDEMPRHLGFHRSPSGKQLKMTEYRSYVRQTTEKEPGTKSRRPKFARRRTNVEHSVL